MTMTARTLEKQQAPDAGIRGVVRLTARELRLQRRVTLLLTIAPMLGVGLAIWWLWGVGISTLDFGLFLGFYLVTGVGISVGFHRLLTHRAFVATKPIRVALAVAGSAAVEGSAIQWCATHRRHHFYADEFGDPHSPHLAQASGLKGVLMGLWHAHVGWFLSQERSDPREWAPDLVDDPAIKRVDRNFGWITLGSFLLPPVLALAITGSLAATVSAFLWGSLVRIFLLHHMTWSINSICHFFGKEAYQARDESGNVWALSPVTFGEAWHNNHHAFPWSARLGLRFWQIDIGWYVIRTLKWVRLVTRVKVPTRAQMAARRLR